MGKLRGLSLNLALAEVWAVEDEQAIEHYVDSVLQEYCYRWSCEEKYADNDQDTEQARQAFDRAAEEVNRAEEEGRSPFFPNYPFF